MAWGGTTGQRDTTVPTPLGAIAAAAAALSCATIPAAE
jgi:hypothetical protein